ncbi:MAG: class I SAM-dependent methyltransferase [Desulfomonilaceae bacterium]
MSQTHYVKEYENRPEGYPWQLVGVHPMGGGGLVEYPYRCYFELKHLRQIVPLTKNMNVLELGCGNGRWIKSLAPLVKHYTGVDSDQEGITIARERTLDITNVDIQELNIRDFRGDRSYDFVYFSAVSEYNEDNILHIVLENLSKWFTPTTIIVDRSTINYKQSSINREKNGCYVYRTPQQIEDIYGKHGFVLQYTKRSYRPLRLGRFLSKQPLEPTLSRVIEVTQPVSFYVMLSLSFLADILHPTERTSLGISHDFFLFSCSSEFRSLYPGRLLDQAFHPVK